jgi:hypothetical protein
MRQSLRHKIETGTDPRDQPPARHPTEQLPLLIAAQLQRVGQLAGFDRMTLDETVV